MDISFQIFSSQKATWECSLPLSLMHIHIGKLIQITQIYMQYSVGPVLSFFTSEKQVWICVNIFNVGCGGESNLIHLYCCISYHNTIALIRKIHSHNHSQTLRSENNLEVPYEVPSLRHIP